jgi:alkyl sulfatase BDS1-like metallo-beta-lactamase superfamily hydrolase
MRAVASIDRPMGLIDPDKIGHVERIFDGVVMIHGFANVGAVETREGLLLVDTAAAITAPAVLRALHTTLNAPVKAIVYTHGHVDHVGGTPAILDDARERGRPRPEVWSHERVMRRFARYRRTWAWNNEVNRRQFAMPPEAKVFPESFVEPDRTYADRAAFVLGGERIELVHAEAETDDATWVWLPERKVALVGDLLIHSMPNTGNPNKPPRCTLGWAEALEAIASRGCEHIVPGHGDPVHGQLAIEMLSETARALRFLHDAVLDRLNAGQWPDEIVDAHIELPPDLAGKTYLRPVYGCAAFVVRDVLREYAGWWGGDPSALLPAPRRAVAQDLLELIGRDALLARARALHAAGETRRALHLAVVALDADPHDDQARATLAEILEARASEEPSFIARNFYSAIAQRTRQDRRDTSHLPLQNDPRAIQDP